MIAAWLVYLSISKISKPTKILVKMNGLILISFVAKCPNVPKAHTNRFNYHQSIAMIFRPLPEPAKSGIVVLCADGHTCHTFHQITSFLADYPKQCTIAMGNHCWCFRCKICLDDIPSFTFRRTHHHPQRYIHLSTIATNDVGLWRFADYPNLADTYTGCNIYSFTNVDWLHKLLKGLFNDHTWKCIVGF